MNELQQHGATDLREIQSSHGASTDLILNSGKMEQMQNLANFMASGSATVPKHLQGNSADCLAVIMQSVQWGMNPFAVAQKTHLVSGTLGYEAQLVNAVIASSNKINESGFSYEFFGDWQLILGRFKVVKNQNGKTYHAPNWKAEDEAQVGVIVRATLRGDSSPRELMLYLSQAQVRNSTLWASDPRQQLAYLAVKRWARLYAPDVILGVYTADELTAPMPVRDVTPVSNSETLNAAVALESSDDSEELLALVKAATSAELLEAARVEIADSIARGRIDDSGRDKLMDAFNAKRLDLRESTQETPAQ